MIRLHSGRRTVAPAASESLIKEPSGGVAGSVNAQNDASVVGVLSRVSMKVDGPAVDICVMPHRARVGERRQGQAEISVVLFPICDRVDQNGDSSKLFSRVVLIR